MTRYVAPCRDDPKCYRSVGHDGPHAYPDDSPQPTTYIDPCPVCGRRPNARMRKWLASDSAPVPGLSEAWARAVAALPEGWGLSVGGDGPGYRADANAGCNGPTITEWSVDDAELVGDPDIPATPAKALLKLAARLAEPR